MDLLAFMNLCKSKVAVSEEFPFDPDTLVYKVAGKMFAVTALEKEFSITLKTSEEKSILLQDLYPNIVPAWHFNKKYWITINQPWLIDTSIIIELINESYQLVISKLPKKTRTTLQLMI